MRLPLGLKGADAVRLGSGTFLDSNVPVQECLSDLRGRTQCTLEAVLSGPECLSDESERTQCALDVTISDQNAYRT